ncbi:hypothetical protein LJY25_14840 [Hymenobacter sp. BT175]|uniref:hypothetical protein n=1 Tax=Hymenobacter translucens TaxID=2886507 RepID=UPI001D0EFAE8|nr:hypothetical protein [Hymenobacter translucens]MCC2547730.1 hypothetical protein [Hymenobacter translucens]
MRQSTLAKLALLAIVALLGLCLAACRASKPDTTEVPAPKIEVASNGAQPGAKTDSLAGVTPAQGLETPKTDGAQGGQKSGIFSAVGDLFSTPEGKAHRREVRLKKAAVPRKLGKGAVYAPDNQGQIAAAWKNAAPIANADSGAVVHQAASKTGPAIVGDGNTVTQPAATDWKATLAKPFSLLLAALALGGVVYGIYLLWPARPRRKQDETA